MVAAAEDTHGPRTWVGRWLRAGAQGQGLLADVLFDELKRNADLQDPAVFQAHEAVLLEAFCLMMQQRFRPDVDVRVITAWVDQVHQVAYKVDLLTGEALVRKALGEDIEVETTVTDVIVTLPLLFARAYTELYRDPINGPDEAALDAIIVEAERQAALKGFHAATAGDTPQT